MIYFHTFRRPSFTCKQKKPPLPHYSFAGGKVLSTVNTFSRQISILYMFIYIDIFYYLTISEAFIRKIDRGRFRFPGAIIFGSDQEVAGVMRAVRRCNATGSFSWIGSDGWSARSLVSDGNEAEVLSPVSPGKSSPLFAKGRIVF